MPTTADNMASTCVANVSEMHLDIVCIACCKCALCDTYMNAQERSSLRSAAHINHIDAVIFFFSKLQFLSLFKSLFTCLFNCLLCACKF